MIQELKKYKTDSRLAMIIRHGDRDKIPAGEFGNDVLLNKQGEENSFALGQSLQEYQLSRILTSPIQRCVQTAEQIVKGYGKQIEIIETMALGAPGLHISDDTLAGEYFLQHGFFKILDEFRQGMASPGLRNFHEFNEQMTHFIYSNTAENGITIYVTHDSLIALYDYCLNKKIYTQDNWVEYLGGIIIKTNGNEQ
jgi:broad specificity phosphatase PhoE